MHSNSLINESSPYLIQHAHNPVNWFPWGDEALEKAKKENKPILISIGYAACHWCHVMEHESFEDEETAKLMNDYFVCIKVDREERPDIDQIYMSAVQIMTGRGGWPLNCFALTDGRPFYGGTYFPKKRWQDILVQLHSLYTNEFEKLEEYSHALAHGIVETESIKLSLDQSTDINQDSIHEAVNQWMKSTDPVEGGSNRTPKFPLPNNYLFLLRYGKLANKKEVSDHVHLTLKKMAMGGIYDQLGGGFSRYSTDAIWKVPHFEKMLYDNVQLMSLYAEAYKEKEDSLYKEICKDTANFLIREMESPDGWFYSALDADSDGIEGQYYTWKADELKSILNKDEFDLASRYFNINEHGYWEDNRYILLKKESELLIARSSGKSEEEIKDSISRIKAKMLEKRETKTWPGLDNKMLTSWNGMAIRGFSDMYGIFKEEIFYHKARQIAEFIVNNMMDGEGRLMHTLRFGKPYITGFLEDYCFVIDGFIALYEASFEEKWLHLAQEICKTAIQDFSDPESGVFWFTSLRTPKWLSRQVQIDDNVIPSSNSVMAKNLFYLGTWFCNPEWKSLSEKMLGKFFGEFKRYAPGYSNWGILAMHVTFPYREIMVCGKNAKKNALEIKNKYSPNILFTVAENDSDLPLMEGRSKRETAFYICLENTCLPPVHDIQEAKKLLNQ